MILFLKRSPYLKTLNALTYLQSQKKLKFQLFPSLNYKIRMKKLLEVNTANRPLIQKSNSISFKKQASSYNNPTTKGPKQNALIIKNEQKCEPKPKQYCCLYHYTEGKKTKGISPCNNHVNLGVINPITTLTRDEKQIIKEAKQNNTKKFLKQQQIVLQADPYEFNFHTHFMNEIEKRGSKPKQLIKPRVYVEKILPKNYVRKNQFLYPKTQTESPYKEVYNLYKVFSNKTQFKSEKQVKDDILAFAKLNNIKTTDITSQIMQMTQKIDKTTASQYLFSKQDFIAYLMSHNFMESDAETFWYFAYNKDRFVIPQRSQASLPIFKNQFVSMKAFIYNFKKFYLEEEEYYRNVFSEPAFRQRMIDLRLLLEPWFNKNIVLKSKLRKWKKNELQTAQFLKASGYEREYQQMLRLIEDRNRIYFLMRTIAKSIYDLTDQKNFGMDVWNDRITFLIEQKSDGLICFMEFIERFKEDLVRQQLQNSQSNGFKTFKITDLLEYLNQNKQSYEYIEEKWIINWIRNIYKYLFHFKEHEQLYLDSINFKLCCKSPIIIEKELISQFIRYKSIETDNLLQVLKSLTEQVEQKLSQMPELQGKKKYLVECNYLAETLLRIIKRNNFAVFDTLYQVNKIVQEHWFDFQNCYQDIIKVLRSSPQKTLCFNHEEKLWRELFTPFTDIKQDVNISQISQSKDPYTYKNALDKYQNVKNALGIVTSITKKLVQPTNQSQARNSRQKPAQKQIKNLPKKAGQFLQRIEKEKQETKEKVEQFDWELNYKRHNHENCGQGYCLHCEDVISTQVSSTIGRVEDMESYLMDLLRDV